MILYIQVYIFISVSLAAAVRRQCRFTQRIIYYIVATPVRTTLLQETFFGGGWEWSGDCGGGRVYIVKSNSRFREILNNNIFPNLTEITIAATTTTTHGALNVANTDQRLRSIILLQYFPNLYVYYIIELSE